MRNIGVVGSGQAVLHDAIAPDMYKDKFGNDGVTKNIEDEGKHGSSRLVMQFGETGKDLVVNFGLDYERAGATLLYTHGYRLSQHDQRSNTDNERANQWHYKIIGELGDKKKKETDLIIPVGSYGLYSKPSKLNETETQKLYQRDFDILQDHSNHAKRYMQEATNSISEAIGLAHLCEERYLPFAVSLQGNYHPVYGLYLKDPHYGDISHLDAMNIIEEKTGGYVGMYFSNCGEKREGYELFYPIIGNYELSDKYAGGFPNDAFSHQVAHNCSFTSYDDVEGELDHDDWHIEQLAKYPFIRVVGNCCGTTPQKTQKLVTKLQHNNYSIGNDFNLAA